MGHCWTSPSTSISSTLQSALLQYFNSMSRPYICQKFKTQAPSTPLCTGISFLPGVLLHWSCVVYFVQLCTCSHVPYVVQRLTTLSLQTLTWVPSLQLFNRPVKFGHNWGKVSTPHFPFCRWNSVKKKKKKGKKTLKIKSYFSLVCCWVLFLLT